MHLATVFVYYSLASGVGSRIDIHTKWNSQTERKQKHSKLVHNAVLCVQWCHWNESKNCKTKSPPLINEMLKNIDNLVSVKLTSREHSKILFGFAFKTTRKKNIVFVCHSLRWMSQYSEQIL